MLVCIAFVSMHVYVCIFVPPMRKSSYSDHCKVKIINQSINQALASFIAKILLDP